jgi:predicted MFS family arabinose efflux permease
MSSAPDVAGTVATATHHPGYLRITLIFAAAAFVVGTATYFVAGVLAQIASELGVSVGVAGQLTSAFAVAYALTAPFLVSLTARFERRRLICIALLVFAAANLLAALAPSFGVLILSRVLAALAATLITPIAVAAAAQLAPMHHRGAVMATVMGGITVAFALGVPLGTYIGAVFDWRTVFFALAMIAVLAALVVRRWVPRVRPAKLSDGPRRSVLRDPAIVILLLMTVCAFAAAFTVFAFIGPLLSEVVGTDAGGKSILLLVFGIAALFGTFFGGWLSDRIGSGSAVTAMLLLFVVAHLGFSLLPLIKLDGLRYAAAMLTMVLAALPGFAFMPIQQARLAIRAAEATPIAIAWHASSIFVGQGLGAVIGGLVTGADALAWLGATAAGVGLITVGLSIWINHSWFGPAAAAAKRRP